jgi:hypothetical protein
LEDLIPLDSDILWSPAFDTPENNYRDFFETWLRVCKNIAQSGRSTVLFGAGAAVPENLENCIEKRYFSGIHYLALVCSDQALIQRLQARPKWRNRQQYDFITEQIHFNQWFMNYNNGGIQPVIRLINTSQLSPEETAFEISNWIRESL